MRLASEPGYAGRILVVDDMESNRYVVATWLRRSGYHVIEATTGAEALAIASAQSVDLVVLDINLPDMTGYEVCEQIKAQKNGGAVPVLHVSATAIAPADRSEGLRRGAEGYLVEPIEREELLASVQALLRGAEAQRAASRLAGRLRQLNDATLAVNGATSIERLISTIAREASWLFDAIAVVALVIEDIGVRVTAAPHAEPSTGTWKTETVDAMRRLAATHTVVPASSLGALAEISKAQSYLAAELTDPNGHRGVLLIGVGDGPGRSPILEDTDVALLGQFARAASTAIANMHSYNIERRIALTLQRHLLPAALPAIPGLDVAVRYEASTEHAAVGGDFYEIFSVDAGRVVLAIGDVVGHSLEAAAVMAQLRTGIRSYALDGHGPAPTLDRLNRLLLQFHPDYTATVCCGVYDLQTGQCELANAGHLPPLIVGSGGTRFLPLGGALLGVESTSTRSYTFTLAPGDVLVLYTDGLVERRTEPLDRGLERLREAAASAAAGNLDEFCQALLDVAGPASAMDDIAVVAIRPTRDAASQRR